MYEPVHLVVLLITVRDPAMTSVVDNEQCILPIMITKEAAQLEFDLSLSLTFLVTLEPCFFNMKSIVVFKDSLKITNLGKPLTKVL